MFRFDMDPQNSPGYLKDRRTQEQVLVTEPERASEGGLALLLEEATEGVLVEVTEAVLVAEWELWLGVLLGLVPGALLEAV